MRIISGKYRSRQFHPPKYFEDRPTTDQSKEGLFNILNNYFDYEDLNVLDLFAGSGSITYEFLSRGCNRITAVEKNKKYVDFIMQTIQTLSPEQSTNILNLDVFKYMDKTDLSEYNLVFADPPYDNSKVSELPDLVLSKTTQKMWLILEHSGKYDFSKHPNFSENRHYGKVNFTFFEK